MIDFLRKLWELVRPYRARLALGVFTGILAGFMPALMIASIALIVEFVFPSADQKPIEEKLAGKIPTFATQWLHDARLAMENGLHEHRTAAIVLVVIIPLVMFLRGLVTYLNVYFLQWVAIRTITDLRVKLFNHLLNLSAGFFNQSRSGELISPHHERHAGAPDRFQQRHLRHHSRSRHADQRVNAPALAAGDTDHDLDFNCHPAGVPHPAFHI